MSDRTAIRIERVAPIQRLSVRATAEAAAALDVALPTEPCRSDGTALWLGPDEWLVLGAQLPATPPGVSIVDVSHAFIGISIAGPCSADTINAFCALDLHISAFPPGMCTRTLFGKAQIILWRINADTFRIEVARSIAPYVWDLLEQAGREFLA